LEDNSEKGNREEMVRDQSVLERWPWLDRKGGSLRA
jgi:hypothetical protein